MQIVWIIIAVLLFPFKLLADSLKDSASITYDYYSDNVGVNVYSPMVALTKKLGEKFALALSYRIDAITAASMRQANGKYKDGVILDSITSASGRNGFDDFREAVTLSASYENDETTLSLGGYTSTEIDYTVYSGFASLAQRFNDANTVFTLGGSYSAEQWNPTIRRALSTTKKGVTSLNASLMQLIDPHRYLQVRVNYIHQAGALASPYHYVVNDSIARFDAYPDLRDSVAAAAQFVTTLGESASMHLIYRYYQDSWQIVSHAPEAKLFYDIADNFTVGVRARYYMQNGAYFSKPIDEYSNEDDYFVSDYRYTPFNAMNYGVSMRWVPELFSESIALSLAVNRYESDENAYIKSWYNQDKIEAYFMSFGLDYTF